MRSGEYARKGEFHRNLNPNWSYYPTYINKVELIDEWLCKYSSPTAKILDAGCGEGVLVEKYAQQGWDIIGVDKNYSSAYVKEGSITEIPYPDKTFDTVMALDVLEHLLYPDQLVAVGELMRVLKPGGMLLISVPNVAHFTSRLKFLFRGKLLRTATVSHHPGDRPFMEYKQILAHTGLTFEEIRGIFPTVPPIYRMVMRYPSKCAGLLRFFRTLPFQLFPVDWHFQTLFACRMP